MKKLAQHLKAGDRTEWYTVLTDAATTTTVMVEWSDGSRTERTFPAGAKVEVVA